jgi:Tfp pilus assembly protein PilF
VSDRRISHFELETLLGEGALDRVYRARDTALDRPVALKLLSARTLGDPSFPERFRREARRAAQLDHPHIAAIYAFGEEEGEAYIAMEFVEGEDLGARLKRDGALPVADVRRFGRQAASALAAAHARGVVHGDIKPPNLMITPEGDLKVIGFGVARLSGETELTMAGALVGTANIMAPETVEGAEPTPASDLFSLGCVLYECLAGRPAFPGRDLLAVLNHVVNRDPVPVEELRPDTPGDLAALVAGLLRKDPASRIGPAREVERVLTEGTPWTPFPPRVRRGRRMPAVWLLVILAAMITVGAGIMWVALRDASHAGGNRELAVTLTTQAVKTVQENPGSAPVRDQAEGTYREAIEADSTYAVPRNNLGRILFEKGRTAEAATQLRAAVRLDPENAAAHANLADALEAQGNRDAAERECRAAIRLDRGHKVPAAPNNLALLLVEMGRGSEGVPVLEKAQREYPALPKSAAFWKNYGLALLAAGREAGADSAFARGAAIDPGYLVGKAGEIAAGGDTAAARALLTAVSEASDPAPAARAREALDGLGDGH